MSLRRRAWSRWYDEPATLMEMPEGKRVLVLSPHFDDDAIGCGGTLIKHIKSGVDVSVTYMTDGRGGDSENPDKESVECIRKQEVEKSANVLGITSLKFLDFPDGDLRCDEQTVSAITSVLKDSKPDVVYLPWFLDNHRDHQACTSILGRAHRRVGARFKVCAYEVHTPLPKNRIVDITGEIERKNAAISMHESQLRRGDYCDTAVGLNRYRSIHKMKGVGYAEAFIYLDVEEYIRLSKYLGGFD